MPVSRRRTLAAAIAVALPALAAAAGNPVADGSTDGAAGPQSLTGLGAQLYAVNCSACHGIAGAGKTRPGPASGAGNVAGIGPSLRGAGALAADFYLRTGYMPLSNPYVQPRRSRVLFTERQIRGLIAYIASLGPGPAAPHPDPASGSVSEGFGLYSRDCAGCHTIVGAGGYLPDAVAPPLSEDSPQQIAEAVRIGPSLMPRFSPQRLSDQQLDSVIAYVQYAKAPDDRGGWALGHVGPVPEGLIAWLVAGIVLVAVTLTAGRRLT
jgi:ubiquinol-cytochrome c reductase cytochrome c subunit